MNEAALLKYWTLKVESEMPSSEKTNASHEVSDDILRLHNPDCHDIQHPEKSSNNSNYHFEMRTPDSVDKYADLNITKVWLYLVNG